MAEKKAEPKKKRFRDTQPAITGGLGGAARRTRVVEIDPAEATGWMEPVDDKTPLSDWENVE